MEKTEYVGAVAAGGLRYDIEGRDRAEVRPREERQDPSAGEDRRLKLIYTPLDGGSIWRCGSTATSHSIRIQH